MINGASLWASRPRYRYGLHSPQKFVAAAKLVLSTSSRRTAGMILIYQGESLDRVLPDEEEDSIGARS